MAFDNDSYDATTEIMALATICEQTPMRELDNGAYMFAYDKEGASNAQPGERDVGFTMIDMENGMRSDVATNSLVGKILSSGQIFHKNGTLNEAFAEQIDKDAGSSGCVDALRVINPRDPQVGREQIGEFNKFAVQLFAQSSEWVRGLIDRTNIMRNMISEKSSACVYGAVQKLNAYIDLARDVCKKKSMSSYEAQSQSK